MDEMKIEYVRADSPMASQAYIVEHPDPDGIHLGQDRFSRKTIFVTSRNGQWVQVTGV